MELPEDLRASVLADIAREPSPTAPQLRRGEYGALALCVVLAVVGMFAMERLVGARAMPQGRPDVYIVLATAAFAVLALVASLFAFGRKSMVGPPLSTTLLLTFGAPALVLGVLLVLTYFVFPETRAQCVNAGGKPRIGFVCMDLTLALGAVPVLALVFARRLGMSLFPLQAGLGTGLAVGAWTGVGMTLSCECTNPEHVALGHVMPMVALAVVGGVTAWLLSRFPRNRLGAR